MKFLKKRAPTPQVSRIDAFESIPVKNMHLEEECLASGEILVRYPTTLRPFLAGLIKRLGGPHPRVQIRKLQLDELGTEVWGLIDGRRTVREIIETFAGTHQVQTREAEMAVTQYIRDLGKRGLVGMR